jgi:hypothetical protein
MGISELLNPWRVIRKLRERNAYLEGRCDEIAERAEEAEERAFRRASEHYYSRSRMVEEHLRATQEQLVTLSSLQPIKPFVIPGSILATMQGEGGGG